MIVTISNLGAIGVIAWVNALRRTEERQEF